MESLLRWVAMAQSHLTPARWAWLTVLLVSLCTAPWAAAQSKNNSTKASASAQQRAAKAGKSQHRAKAAKAPAHGDTPEVQALANRLLLHACSLELQHPATGQMLRFASPAPF